MGKALLIFAGLISMFQGAVQTFLATLAIIQYYCLIDFLQQRPISIFLKILYFHNPDRCGIRIPIGQALEGVVSQAFVLIPDEPFTSTRTFILNCISLGLGCIWMIASCILLAGGATNDYSRPVRWPWITVTTVICVTDLAAGVLFLGDTFHTKTLNAVMSYIGGTLSGTGGTNIDTSATAWIMSALYIRFGIFFVINIILIVLVGLNGNRKPKSKSAVTQISVQSQPSETYFDSPTPPRHRNSNSANNKSNMAWYQLPRAYANQAYKKMKKILLEKAPSSTNDSVMRVDAFTTPKSPWLKTHTKRRTATVNFPENLMSLPQRVEYMICDEHRKMRDIRSREPTPHPISTTPSFKGKRSRLNSRVSAIELQSQMPWSYTATPSAFCMRDNISSNEELPPVPVADYTASAGPSTHKALVHQSKTPRYQRRQRMEAVTFKGVPGTQKKTKRNLNRLDLTVVEI